MASDTSDTAKDEIISEIYQKIGRFGKFQIYSFVLGCLAVSMSGMNVVTIIFMGKEIPHRCLVEECENTTTASFNEEFINFSIPSSSVADQSWDACKMYSSMPVDDKYNTSSCQAENFNQSILNKCTEYVYDTSVFTATSTSEFDVVCDHAWLQPLANSLFQAGGFSGTLLTGEIGDRYGRVNAVVFSLLIIGVAGIGSAVSPNYYVFLLTRFMLGNSSPFQSGFVLVVEYMSPKWRSFAGIMLQVPFALGEAAVAAFAFYIRDWRWLQLACAIPSILLLSYWWILPESIRWLLSTGQKQKASKIIKKIGKWNNIDVTSCLALVEKHNCIPGESKKEKEDKNERRVLDILKYPKMRIRTMILFFIWLTVKLCYYGLSANTVNLSGDLFVNVAAVMLIEIPSYIFAYLLSYRIGRKGTLCLSLLIGGLACFISGLLPTGFQQTIVSLTLAGKFGISAGFAIIYLVTAELVPTNCRSITIAAMGTFSTLGAVAAPYISYLDTFYKGLPLLVFGTMAIVSFFLAIYLPETASTELPQTWQESEDLGKNQNLFIFVARTKEGERKEPKVSTA